MKLKTSFFNATVLRKDITRFAPVWGIYSVILLLAYLIDCMDNIGHTVDMLRDLDDYFPSFGIVNLFYAWICAMAVFGDLYKSRLCNALHAMPVRREGWFFAHVVAAVLFCAVPNTIMAVFISPILGQYWYLAFLWLAVSLMQFITMFGMAAFMAMCSGTRLGLFIAYTAANLWPYLVKGFVKLFYADQLYGVPLDIIPVDKLWPVNYYSNLDYITVQTVYEGRLTWTHFQGVVGSDILTVALLTLAGVAMLGGALLLYRRRKLEAAGDFMANRLAAIVFHVLFCMFVGWVFCGIGSETALGGIIIGLLGITVGFFTGKMLLQRKVNVFVKKNFAIWGLVMAIMLTSLILSAVDPLGITRKVPKLEQIKSVSVYEDSSEYYSFLNEKLMYAEEPENIEPILTIQKKIIQQKKVNSSYNYIVFDYTLTNGRTFKRAYPVSVDALDQSELHKYYSNWENLFATSDWDGFCSGITEINIYNNSYSKHLLVTENLEQNYSKDYVRMVPLDDNSREKMVQLLETMKEECKEKNIFPEFVVTKINTYSLVEITTRENGEPVTRRLLIGTNCVDSRALIDELMDTYFVN